MKNSKRKVILLASCLLTASLCMPVPAHAKEIQDNAIGVTDIVILKKYLHGKQTITQEQFTKLDRNHDNLVNIYDFVLLKKELISGGNTSQLQAKTRIDTTSAINYSAWESATSDESYVIQSVQELNEIISPMFHAGVVREFNQIYDEIFFENNVLLLDLEPPESQTIFKITGCEYNSKNQLEIQYEKEIVLNDVVLTTDKQLIIGQVAIPKDQYHDNDVIWRIKSGYVNAKTMEEPIAYEFKSDIISSTELNFTLDEKILITTQEELIEFLAERFDDETVATYQELYPAEFFETKNVYLEIDGRILGDEYSVWRVTETTMQDDSRQIIIYSKTSWGYGDIADYYLNQVIMDKVDNISGIDETNIIFSSDVSFDGDVYYYDIPRTFWESNRFVTIAVNIYQFGDEKEIAIYKVFSAGFVPYGRHELLGSFIYTGEENVFKSGYATETDENGNYIGKDFSIDFHDNSIVINYTGAENPIEIAVD